MKPQEILLNKLRSVIPKNISLNEEIAKVLDISYDAAHRRISSKSKFSIDETVTLCQYYSLSMDHLFGSKQSLIVQKTQKIETLKDFKSYFETTKELLTELKADETTVYYAAKDIPMNYAAAGSLYSKFKFYVWYNLLTKQQSINFESFLFEESVFIDHTDLKNFFNSSKRVEIWNDTTINSSLQQTFYFFESGLLNYTNALDILKDLQFIIKNMEQKCEIDSPEFQMYYNELLLLNNSVLFTSKSKSLFFLPYDALGYYATRDIKACEEQREYIENQLINSKSLNKSGRKDRKIFFNRIYQKIEFYHNKIENYVIE